MTARSKAIFHEAMRLPADERSQVALALLDSSCEDDDIYNVSDARVQP